MMGVPTQREWCSQEVQCASGILRRDLGKPKKDHGDTERRLAHLLPDSKYDLGGPGDGKNPDTDEPGGDSIGTG